MLVACDIFEVARALGRRLLEAFDDWLTLHLVAGQGRLQVTMPSKRVDQRKAVLHRQLGSRSNREVRRVRRVADYRAGDRPAPHFVRHFPPGNCIHAHHADPVLACDHLLLVEKRSTIN